MPTYVYRATDFPSLIKEVVQSIKDDSLKELTWTEEELRNSDLNASTTQAIELFWNLELQDDGIKKITLPVERVILPVKAIFKGSGFYETDYKKSESKKEE